MLHPRSELQIFAVLDSLCEVVCLQPCHISRLINHRAMCCGKKCMSTCISRRLPLLAKYSSILLFKELEMPC